MEKRRSTRRRRSSERVLMILLVAVVLIGCAVGGTIAYFTDTTDAVTNTFVVGKLFANPEEDFTLWEHTIEDQNTDGVYELTATEGIGNAYTVLPGVNLPKDPTVDIVKLELNAYLYIKVEGTLPTGMTYEISSDWEALQGYSGVWVYKGSRATSNVISASPDAKQTFTVNILKDNQIVVADDFTTTATIPNLVFTAYAVQAPGFESAADAWSKTFGATP